MFSYKFGGLPGFVELKMTNMLSTNMFVTFVASTPMDFKWYYKVTVSSTTRAANSASYVFA